MRAAGQRLGMLVVKKLFLRATIGLLFAHASGVAVAQEPATAPVPKLPAMPSLEQKGSDDMTKPAGALAGKAAKPAPEAKRAGKDAKKHEAEPSAVTPKAPISQAKPKGPPAKLERPKAPDAKGSATAKKAGAKHAAKAAKPRKSTPAKKSRRGK